jgi:hypothetical protein
LKVHNGKFEAIPLVVRFALSICPHFLLNCIGGAGTD